ncbi:MAG: ComEC/Rec2 family competence protein [Rhodospirillaceae bacterium]
MTDHLLDHADDGNAAGTAGGWRDGLAGRLAAEREQWGSWAPVGVGTGIVLYFALPAEPPGWLGALVLAAALAALMLGRERPGLVAAALVALTAGGGFAAAQLRTLTQAAPVLQRDLGIVALSGRLIITESMPDGVRLTLAEVRIERLAPEATPARVRIRLAGRFAPPPPGSLIRLKAMLHPPSPPAEPGAYDFQRQAYFEGSGGVGFAISQPELVAGPPPSVWRRLLLPMERARAWLAGRSAAVIADHATATVTAALLNGEQTGIPPEVMADYRASGLAHLLSISGLHIALVAGLVFFVVRALLAMIEPLALRVPIKKWAALTGLVAAVFYLLLVGPAAPTLRSVLMTGTVMTAIIADRNPLSMRLLAISATLIMLYTPEQILGPSFEMSFAAVGGLIATFEVVNPLLIRWRAGSGALGQAALYLGGSMLTSVVATLAVTPFSLYHFQQDALYGVISNMIAVPLTSFWVMPWALLVYILAPFGLEAVALVPMGWGVAACNTLAHLTAALPGAVIRLPAMPDWGLSAIVLGGLWLMLWRGGWRLWGLLPVLAGFASLATVTRPDILVAADGGLIAVRAAGGGLSLSRSGAADRLTAQSWLHRDGTDSAAAPWPLQGRSADTRLACDDLACLYRRDGRTVVLVRDRLALGEDCDLADLVISAEPVHRCPGPRIIDLWSLRRDGAHTIFLSDGRIEIHTVRERRGNRPWCPAAAATSSAGGAISTPPPPTVAP